MATAAAPKVAGGVKQAIAAAPAVAEGVIAGAKKTASGVASGAKAARKGVVALNQLRAEQEEEVDADAQNRLLEQARRQARRQAAVDLELRKLKVLRGAGVITEDEFVRQGTRLLAGFVCRGTAFVLLTAIARHNQRLTCTRQKYLSPHLPKAVMTSKPTVTTTRARPLQRLQAR